MDEGGRTVSEDDREVVDGALAEAGLDSEDRFVDVVDGEKKCLDHDTRHATPPNGNYGIYATASDQLVLLDVDDYDEIDDRSGLDAVEELRDQEPTLVQVSPHGGAHLIYKLRTDQNGRLPSHTLEKRVGTANPNPSWGEVRTMNQYVVGAGSSLDGCDKDDCTTCADTDGGQYTVPNPRPVATIDAATLVETLLRDPDLGTDDEQGSLTDARERDESPVSGGGAPAGEVEEVLAYALDDSEDDRLRSLWRGGENDDRSEAECALALKVAWWIGAGRSTSERKQLVAEVFDGRHTPEGWSAPRVEKWHKRGENYRESVLEAVERVSDPYNPRGGVDDTRSWKEIVAENADQFDDAGEVPDDLLATDATGEPNAAADGGGVTSAWDDADAPDYASRLDQDALKIVAEVDEDESIGDLDDREKAAAVWELCRRSNEVHVRVRRDNGSLWAYDDGIWSEEGERALRHAARQALGARNYGNNVLEELKAQARADPVVEVERGDFGVGAEKIAVANGLLDLEAAADGGDALRDLRPGDYALSQLPVEYDPDASADRWRQFIDEVVESRKIDAVQEYVGYCLDRSGLPHQKALLLVGSGSNGKSTFLNTVKKLLGSENVANTPLHKFEDDDRVAGLYGKLANIDADLSDASLSRDGVSQFKRLTGDDPVEGRHLYEDAFQFDPVSKHLYAANQVPDVSGIVDDTESAFWRRWIIVNFPVYIRKVDRDDTLAETLADELSGILNWAIEGYHRLKGQGYFTDVETEAETRRLWKSWGESADEFIVEHVERDDSLEPDDRLTTSDLWQVYKKWCTRTDRDASGQRAFTLKVKKSDTDFGYGQSVRVSHADSKTPAGYKHLKVSDDLRNLVEEVLDDSDDDRDDGQSSLV